ncbi:MAG: flavodoxin family protein [Bacteroidales bacterium]|nr:flavodoxin family protein [Bacteroidales bacterium]MBD5221408.1 flavodoxin family protein [Bacteroidales bacterium]
MKKILIISTSLRGNSNSHRLAEEFGRGAADSGNDVEIITLHHKDIRFCIGCLSCVKTGKCVLKDDAPEIVGKMHDADILVFATPIYYYEMSGQMKTLLDRANPLFGGDYKFTDIYMLTSAAEDEPEVPGRAISGLEGWIECFERARLAGNVFAGGVTDPGDIRNHPSLEAAYDMGRNIHD